MNAATHFSIAHTSAEARSGTLTTPHGNIATPFFMPVGTLAAVKGITPAQLREAGAQIVLSNTYHLALRPGEEIVERAGGLADFMGWHGPTLTDSGGFQVFSLADIRSVTDEGVRFKSHIDGAELMLSPERAVAIQQALGADMFMVLDECPPANSSRDTVAKSLIRTQLWAQRSRAAWTNRDSQALFGIVQGGLFEDLRSESAAAVAALDLPGNAIGGVSVGESPEDMARIVAHTAPLLPIDKPRYLMGVGRPEDILHAVSCGMDMFDCVIPTRHARHAQAFTHGGTLNMRNARFKEDHAPIMDSCGCYACRTISRGYLRHLLKAGEMLAAIYLTLHNLHYYFSLMADIRTAIREDRFHAFHQDRLAGYAVAGKTS